MIAVYAICHVKADKIAEFEAFAQTLIRASIKDRGCVSYGCGAVQGKENVYTFVELWQSQADFGLHAGQPHFKQAVANFEHWLSQPLEVNVVDLL